MSRKRTQTITREREQAIMLTLLEVPEFRRKAGLAPRDGSNGGDTLQVIGRVLGCSRECVRVIERRALRKLHKACSTDPELRHAIAHLFLK